MFKLRVGNKNLHKFATRKKMAGSGARYKIEFDINELIGTSKLGIEEIITKPADKEGIPFEIKGSIPVRITINEASSDEYELDWPIKNVRAVITRLEGYAPAEEENWRSYWDIDDPIQVDDFIEGLFNDSKYMDIEAFYDENQNYNGFDGVLNNIEFYNGAHEDGITGMDLMILDRKAIDEIEYYCSGEAYKEEEEEDEDEEDTDEYESSKRASFRCSSRRESGLRRFAKKPKYTLY